MSRNIQNDQGSSPKYAARVPESIRTPDVVETSRLGRLEFFDGMPSDETVRKVYDQLDFSRGVETFLTGCPAASIYAMLQGMKEAGMATFSMGITEQLLDARSLWLTPNTTTVYCIAEINVEHGPTVLEVPPGVLGPVDDAFFRWVTDVGFTGPDRGQGGRYLFLPPGYEGEVPDGYHVAPTRSYRNWLLMRAFVIDGDLAKTAAHVKKHWRLYPLKEAASPREPHFVDLSGLQYNTIHANDFSFYEELNAVVQYEPADAFNPELVGLWASIGIKKGKPFAPDERMKRILTEAAAVGNATARALSYRPRSREPYFYEDRQWYTAFVGGSHEFMSNGELMLDYRTFMHYMATGITPAMAHSQVGKGSAYAFTPHDAQGRLPRRWQDLPRDAAGARPRRGILVVRRLLRSAPGPAGDRPEERRRRQPEPGPAGQPGRFLHRLVRANRAHRQGGQLGADHARQELVGPAATLRPARTVVRKDVETG